MPSSHSAVDLAKLFISITIILHIFVANIILAEELESSHPQSPKTEDQATQPFLDSLTDSKRGGSKIIHRIGTSSGKARNSVSIVSTDAGLIHRQPPVSGCTSCGIVDLVNKIGQGPNLNTIANGIVAGTVAGEVIRQIPYPHVPNHPTVIGTIPSSQAEHIIHSASQHHVDVTMSDDKRTIITLPDASHLHRGDRFKLIDGSLAVDH